MIYPEPEKGGRGKKTNYCETQQFSNVRLSRARSVLRHSKDLAENVVKAWMTVKWRKYCSSACTCTHSAKTS